MPQNKRESLIYTFIMCFMMVFWMSIYNVSLHMGGLSMESIKAGWLGFPIAYIFAMCCDWFFVSKLAKGFAFKYLSPEERKAALILSKTVALGKELAKTEKDANKVVEAMKKNIETEPMAKIDYVEAVDALSMEPVEKLEGTCMLAMAVYIGKTRLIDNTLINE